MGEKTCAVCLEPFAGQAAYLVQGARWTRRKWWAASLLICQSCHDNQRGYWNTDHKALPVQWRNLVGRGGQMPAEPCAACGQPVVRAADPLLKRVTCSASCSTSLTRSRNGNQGAEQPCDTCGKEITNGRADSRYCSPACRQKAYRERRATQAALAPPRLDARGRRLPQRSQLKALENGIAGLSGVCSAFARISALEGIVPPSEVSHWQAELGEAQQVVEYLHLKLRVRSGQSDVAVSDAPTPSQPAVRKNLTQSTTYLSGLCGALATVAELSEEVTPEVAARWQADTAGALAGIGNIVDVLTQHSHSYP